ncbi:GumC family protein [Amorphus sp. 3PC139-8]|uniref:GumC family protein n=1 Tax=Amorphus sp. 3PC139-8 TaxID=2735676 RepID=UPI00345DC0FB
MNNPLFWLLRVLWQRRFMIVAITTVGAIASVAVALSLPKSYQASALVEIDPQQEQVVGDSAAANRGWIAPEALTETEIQVIGSQANLWQVIGDLELEYNPAFNPALESEDGLMSRLRPSSEPSKGVSPDRLRTEMVRALRRSLSVDRVGQSSVVSVTYESRSPQLSAEIANAVVDVYLQGEVANSRRLAQDSLGLLRERLDNLRKDVDAREQAVEDWRRESGMAEGASSSLLRERITQLSTELGIAQAALAEAKAESGGAGRTLEQESIDPKVIDSVLIQRLIEREANEARDVAELEALYQPSHPRLIAARASLETLRQAIRTETRKISQSLGRNEQIQTDRVAGLQQDVDGLREELAKQREAEIRLRALEQEAEAARGVYETFLARQNEVQSRFGLERPSARVVAKATPPIDASAPNKPVIAVAGTMFSGFLAAALAIGLALMQRTVSGAVDVEELIGVPPLAELPRVSSPRGEPFRPVRTVIEAPNSSYAEALRALRVSLLIGRDMGRAIGVLVASGDDGEGKTTVAASLARAAALSGDRVLLIDCDFDTPTIHTLFSGHDAVGIANVLLDKADSERAIQIDRQTPALFMSCGETEGAGAEIYRSPAWSEVMFLLGDHLDLVILDAPSLARVPDARFLAGVVDVTLVVTRAKQTSREAMRATVQQLQMPGSVAETAILLNDVPNGGSS